MSPASQRVTGDVLLVGSMPFEKPEQSFREVAERVGGHLSSLPDGEVGPRKNWVGMLPELVYSQHPDLEELRSPATGTMEQPADPDWDEGQEGFWTFRVKPGAEIRFDDLLYGTFALESYDIFRRQREEGVIPQGVRFQVSLPAPMSAVDFSFEEPEHYPMLRRAYMDALRREIDKMLERIPEEDLAIQYDLAWEVVDLAMGDRSFFRFWPRRSFEEKLEDHLSQIPAMSEAVPEGALLGYHWCYGTWGGWPMTELTDLSLCVRLSNEAVRRSRRRVDWVHMPVSVDPDDAFFAPLADLDIRDTKVFLGLIHETDVEGFPARVEKAHRYRSDFGVAGVCGYGRLDPAELPAVLDAHKECADRLS
jgi:hypothetical protein